MAHEHGFSGMVPVEFYHMLNIDQLRQRATAIKNQFFVFLHISKVVGLNVRHARFYTIISRGRLFILTGIYLFNRPPVIGAVPTDKP